MGVNGLTGILSRYAPNSVRVVSSSAFAGQAIAVDASCHLNKFIYGDEPHLHRHIYGFYQLARFFDINKIKPIFVFDGPRRIKAKELEYAKRQRAREKVKYSLLFEKEQSTRLNHWMEMSDQYHQSNYSPTKESLLTILGELGESIDQIELDLPPEKEERIVSLDKQHEIEGQLASVAQELRTALQTVEDTEYYTKTVRELARREKALIAEMIMNHFNGTKSALKMLKRDNQAMLFSLGNFCLSTI
ncbi:MAG: PIN domain-like protein [Benjaminiella poitrasii]|nr:MAG: PIN domain-like protein [Benjaminiella poitrasii]